MKMEEIKILIEKFLDGETTLAEETTLYRFFQSGQVPSELRPYRMMFNDYAELPSCNTNRDVKREPRRIDYRHRNHWLRIVVAASLLLLIGAFVGFYLHREQMVAQTYAGSYMIVDGKRIDNWQKIKPKVKATLKEADKIERKVESEYVINEAEGEVLENITDPQQRAELENLLKGV